MASFGADPILAAGVNASKTLVKAGTVKLGGYHLLNTTAAVAYLQIFDAAAAADVTLGSTTPTLSLGLIASGGAVLAPSGWKGIQFTKGIVVAGTTTVNGNTGAAIDCNFFIGS
jgi:hypothetical protein